MSIPQDLTNNVKQWVSINNQIATLNQQLKILRENKMKLEKQMINNISRNNLTNTAITYQNNKIFIGKENTYSTLSFKYVEEKLNDIIDNKDQVSDIIKYLKTHRNKQSNIVIKCKKTK